MIKNLNIWLVENVLFTLAGYKIACDYMHEDTGKIRYWLEARLYDVLHDIINPLVNFRYWIDK